MHRFWIFPLVLGIVAAVFPAFTATQGWIAFSTSQGRLTLLTGWHFWIGMIGSSDIAVSWFVAFGAGIGLIAALFEMFRFGRGDRSGMQAGRRLVGNMTWVGIYALLVNVSLMLVLVGLYRVGISSSSWSWGYIPGLFTITFLVVNGLAILWATIRTALVDDVLSPRVLRGKWRQSNRAIE